MSDNTRSQNGSIDFLLLDKSIRSHDYGLAFNQELRSFVYNGNSQPLIKRIPCVNKILKK